MPARRCRREAQIPPADEALGKVSGREYHIRGWKVLRDDDGGNFVHLTQMALDEIRLWRPAIRVTGEGKLKSLTSEAEVRRI